MKRRELELGFANSKTKVKVDLPEGEADPWDARSQLQVVGKKLPRIDAPAKVSGAARYTLDEHPPGTLHAAVLRCPFPSAKLVALDLAPAETMAGVKAVIALARPGDRLLFAGQDIAAVAADRLDLAHEALAAIRLQLQELPFVVETAAAMLPGAPLVHETAVAERRTEGDEPGSASASAQQGNVRALPPMQRGDTRAALAKAKHLQEAVYTTQVQTHSALEPHCIVLQWQGKDAIVAWCSTQSIFSVRDELAEVFALQPSKVKVITRHVGGGFGAKFGASAPGSRLGFIAGELARRSGAPVKLACNRHEEQVCTGNRPDSQQRVRIGADASGRITAIEVIAHGTAGIATGAGVGRNAFELYGKCPNVAVYAHDVFTHAGPATAMRAPGHPQGAFALELALDELASKMKLDPLELRLRHDKHPVRLAQLRDGRALFDWNARRKASRQGREAGKRIRSGHGVACSVWGDFGREKAAQVTVTVQRDGSIEVRNGVQDIGVGIATVLAQVVAEVLQQPLARVEVRYGDSELGASVGSGGSQTTASVTPALRNAAEQVRAELSQMAADLLGASSAKQVEWRGGTLHSNGKRLEWTELCKKLPGEAISATASRPKTYGFHPERFMNQDTYEIAGVQFAEVEVDTWTGVVRAKRVLALHDCGRIMNELTCRSQIQGGVILGTSYALMEQRVMDPVTGRMLNPNLESYKIAGSKDVPDIDIRLYEVHTGANNTGAVGIGEPATIPTAAAIANAVYDALGVPVRSLPLTPDKILAALGGTPT